LPALRPYRASSAVLAAVAGASPVAVIRVSDPWVRLVLLPKAIRNL
jgi:hypothetical protein